VEVHEVEAPSLVSNGVGNFPMSAAAPSLRL